MLFRLECSLVLLHGWNVNCYHNAQDDKCNMLGYGFIALSSKMFHERAHTFVEFNIPTQNGTLNDGSSCTGY